MTTTRLADHLLIGDHPSRPAANACPIGGLYSCTTHNKIYQTNGTVWSDYVTSLVGPAGATGAAGSAGATGPAGPGLPGGSRAEFGRVTGINISPFATVSGTVTYGTPFSAPPALVIFGDANGDVNWDRIVRVDSGAAGSFVWAVRTGSSGVGGVLFSWHAMGT